MVLAFVLGLVPAATAGQAEAPDDESARIVHAFNRLAYGPRAGDVERVRGMGLSAWIEQQLRPEKLHDPALEERLSSLDILPLSTKQILEGYEIPGRVVEQLQAAKLIRATHGERQLDEVMVDFWMNHFNVFAGKGLDRQLIVEYERDVIRPHAWGRFEDLLRASAESPAMLVYLDNWLSTDPEAMRELKALLDRRTINPPLPKWQARAVKDQHDAYKKERRRYEEALARHHGVDETYARALLELHTLGTDGGYTHGDVREAARCFTGWTLRGQGERDPRFDFEAHFHAQGDKLVLGRKIEQGGKGEGEQVLHLLATHPATARFISTRLARRFVADEPPLALVERAAAVFQKTEGDIREVVRTIVTSAEFFDPQAHGAKVKTPLEFVVSAVRAADGEVDDARALSKRVEDMGMPLYLQALPTGYEDSADAWLPGGALLERLNFALDLAEGRITGVRVATSGLDGRALGSPEFQRK